MDSKMLDPPTFDLRIDSNGDWRHEGVKITHERTIKIFFGALDIDEQGRFFLQVGKEQAFVQVDDAPYVVTAIRVTDRSINLRLSDDSHEPLDPETLRFTADNVPYCRVREGRMDAKFSRTAYYQLADLIEQERDGFVLSINGVKHKLDLPDTELG